LSRWEGGRRRKKNPQEPGGKKGCLLHRGKTKRKNFRKPLFKLIIEGR